MFFALTFLQNSRFFALIFLQNNQFFALTFLHFKKNINFAA